MNTLIFSGYSQNIPDLKLPEPKVIQPQNTGKSFESLEDLRKQGKENLKKNQKDLEKLRQKNPNLNKSEISETESKRNDDTTKTEIKLPRTNNPDSLKGLNQNAIYNRPFIGVGNSKTAVGGYLEANLNYFINDGISEGLSMEMRRFNVFLYSSISKKIRFLSEIEFEHGVKEINIETALIDFNFHPNFNFRAGILLPQIGVFNANHDSPRWDFIERPLSSTLIIPSTLSEVGFGVFGKFFLGSNVLTYNLNATNGLQDGLIYNEEGRTFLQGGKSPELFAEDNNGQPMINGRISIANRKAGEIGLAYYGGVYNKFKTEGEVIDDKRRVDLFALDISAKILKGNIKAEYVWATIDIPNGIEDIYGNVQNGGFIDFSYPVISRSVFGYDKAQIFLSIRGETVDLNYGKFESTKKPKRDEVWANSFGIGFRPTSSTIFKLNYRYSWHFDLIGTPPTESAGLQFGFASYF